MVALDNTASNNRDSNGTNSADDTAAPTPMRRVYGAVDHIRAVSWLYGMETAHPGQSRTLVLGCGDGYSLLPFAMTYPQAQVVGIELETESGFDQSQPPDVALPQNIQLHRLSLDALLNSEWNPFDYIIVQGSFSLLANDVTDLILSFCQQKLAAQGVIALEWLCQPGAKAMESLRDAIQIHSSRGENFIEQVGQGKDMLAWLKQVAPLAKSTEAVLGKMLPKAGALSDALFAHYFLETKNEASYLVEFNQRIEHLGLAYAGDVKPETEQPDHYHSKLNDEWQGIAQGCGKVMGQQYLDLAVNRHQRFSLLVAQQRAPEILEQPDYTRVKQLRWAGGFRRLSTDMRTTFNALASHDEVAVATDNILTLSILDTLGDAWPYSVSFEQLMFHCRLPDDNPDSPFSRDLEQKMVTALKSLLNKGISGLHIQLGDDSYANCLTHYLTVPDSVTWQLTVAEDRLSVINPWHEVVELTAEERDQLLQPAQMLTEANRALLDALHRKGVLTASVLGWKRYHQQVARDVDFGELGRLTCALLLFSSDVSAGGFFTHEFECLAKATDLMVTGVDDSIDGELVLEINQLLLKNDNKNAIKLVARESERLMKTLKGCYYLVRFYRRVNDEASTIRMLVRMLSFNSTSVFVYSELSMALYQHRMFWAAGRLARAILRCDRSSAPDWFLIGLLHKESKTLDHAEYCARQAMALVPNSQQIVGLVGACLCEQAKTEEGVEFLYSSIKDPIGDYHVYSHLAFVLSHSVNASAQKLLECHLAYAKGEMTWAEQQTFVGYRPADTSPNRKLRIGFVSGDLRDRHPVGFFFTPIWDQLDREQFEFYCYNNCPGYFRNEGTHHFEETADGWREIQNTNALELAEMIKADQIDVLIDLSGHTGYNRLSTFALKPAPIQISWVGYHATTGLPTMDYYATIFPVTKDPAIEAQFTEKLIYLSLPHNFGSLEKQETVNPLPALSNGYFTFGSFNRPNKLNDGVLDAWAQVLNRVPMSRMIIGNVPTAIWATLLEKMRFRGIDVKRIKLLENMELQKYFQAHHEVDLLLDTFPFTGGTVTNHAVWMGVPTISLAGETLVSRQGSSIMQSLGLSAFVADSIEDYVERAVAWANKPEELNTIRLDLRARVNAASEGGDHASVSDYVGQMFRECWRRYCLGLAPESFAVGTLTSADE